VLPVAGGLARTAWAGTKFGVGALTKVGKVFGDLALAACSIATSTIGFNSTEFEEPFELSGAEQRTTQSAAVNGITGRGAGATKGKKRAIIQSQRPTNRIGKSRE
jgi:hypothetical protein